MDALVTSRPRGACTALQLGLALTAALTAALPAPAEAPPPAKPRPSIRVICSPPAHAEEPAPPPAQAECPAAAAAECCAGFDWSKVPPARPTPRNGMFLVPPTGPGYYSLLDQLHDNCQEKAPNLPYGTFAFTQTPAYDLDFRYLDKPDNRQDDFFDPLKRIHVGDNWLVSFGGQAWLRSMNEVSSRLTARDNHYELLRARLYADVWYQDRFRFFAEGLYAESFHHDLDPLPIDINRGDFLNLFADVKVFQADNGPVYVRAGRQEVLLGSQRLISTLDWANTRRNFDGVRGFYLGEKWDVDLFWLQPVRVNRNFWDNVDNNQNFFGLWATRKIKKGTAWDFYYLDLDNTNPAAPGRAGVRGAQNVHTLGTRLFGDYNNWLFDMELMFQFGTFADQDKLAASTPLGFGYHFADRPWTPQIWLYYDWASGDASPGLGGTNHTFNQLFPFGHYYYGFLDQVGRQNIQDVYTQLAFYPQSWLTGLVQYHNFWLDSSRDALYNAAGVVVRQDPTGSSGHFVGSEIDLLLSAQLTRHTNLLLGWSKLFAGDFIRRTGPNVSPELFYMQVNYRW